MERDFIYTFIYTISMSDRNAPMIERRDGFSDVEQEPVTVLFIEFVKSNLIAFLRWFGWILCIGELGPASESEIRAVPANIDERLVEEVVRRATELATEVCKCLVGR